MTRERPDGSSLRTGNPGANFHVLSSNGVPPHNLEAEVAVLGSILLDRHVIAQARDLVDDADFMAWDLSFDAQDTSYKSLKAVLEGPFEPEQLPAQFVQPESGKVLWLVDQAAGSMLAQAKK